MTAKWEQQAKREKSRYDYTQSTDCWCYVCSSAHRWVDPCPPYPVAVKGKKRHAQ